MPHGDFRSWARTDKRVGKRRWDRHDGWLVQRDEPNKTKEKRAQRCEIGSPITRRFEEIGQLAHTL